MPFEKKRFLETLKKPNLTNAELAGLFVDAGVAGEWIPTRTFPLGIVLDNGRRYEFRVKPADLDGLVGSLTRPGVRGVRSYRVFPLGIVTPKEFRVEVDLGLPEKHLG